MFRSAEAETRLAEHTAAEPTSVGQSSLMTSTLFLPALGMELRSSSAVSERLATQPDWHPLSRCKYNHYNLRATNR